MPFIKRSDLNRPLTSGEVDNNFALAETLFYAGQAAGKVFENTGDGLAGTTDGQFFTVPDGAGGFSVYRNDAGVATLIGSADGATGMDNPMTAAGDLITGGTGGAPTNLPIGANGQVLTVDSGVPVWETLPDAGMTNPMTTAGDLIVGGTGGTPTRLLKGTSGQVLTISGGTLAWDTPAVSGALFTTLTNKTADRNISTTYTNTTGKPLGVYANFSITLDGRRIKAVVNGLTILNSAFFNNYDHPGIFFIVPPGATYSASYDSSTSGVAIFSWFEMS